MHYSPVCKKQVPNHYTCKFELRTVFGTYVFSKLKKKKRHLKVPVDT